MSVLIDTSVWIDHFRNQNDVLVNLIELDLALAHPMVIVEIACGTPPTPRIQTLNSISLLQPCNQASSSEVMEFIEREGLYGLGCGLVDISLLASTLITPGAELWTLDKRLDELAERFGVAHLPTLH
ncbi:MAG: VapC toxin family PIN domain ribonuclease [Burkholderiales bacterium]|jgi:predicted nucleic acid-binding protein|nr:VapC toxin family PIN domain ribonuclease [Burkholderiales bacterium]MCA3161967.1 VapC toxin family PIN domain ribonuclease [Burkholderiales bacterium]MCA3164889.1 VapC toxin family PIN domain ribonuclease [Burkholderiales bacterium]MCA3169473.1 VapC toxin family PIN domain ribonuclease [Burkholderiales bacterium]MCA3171533.1 VapC toxin family PIN domain ribonuclease [Burkholderiales bacterium]